MEWTGARYADKPTVEVETFVAAPPEQVWELVCDIHLMAELSDELQRVEWRDGVAGPSVGARFIGFNRHEAFGEWQSPATIIECERPCRFAWAIGDDVDRPGAVWRFTLTPTREGTTLRQWAQLGPARSGLSVAIDRMPDKEQKIVFTRLREFETGMTANVAAIKRRAEGIATEGRVVPEKGA